MLEEIGSDNESIDSNKDNYEEYYFQQLIIFSLPKMMIT